MKKILKKTLSIILTFNLLLQSFAPFLVLPVYADESTPSASTEVTPTPIVEPTPEITPTPTEEITPTPEISPEVTPTTEVTPTPIVEPAPTSVIASDSAAIPDTEVTPTIEVIPTIEPTPTSVIASDSVAIQDNQSSSPPENSDQSTTVIASDSVAVQEPPAPVPSSITSISNFIQAVAPQPTLSTDKADYFPTDIAYITGLNFLPNTTYTLHIMSSDMPYVSFKVEVTSDETGRIFYAYQLDGNYRPNYSLDALDASGTIIATLAFTDGSSWPCDNFNCTANDTTVSSLVLVDTNNNPITSCITGQSITAKIRGTFVNHTGSNRYAGVLVGDVYQGTSLIQHLNTNNIDGVCAGNTIASNSSVSTDIYSFNWTCGQTVTVKSLVLSWSTSSTTCSAFFNDAKCNSRSSQCYSGSDFSVSGPGQLVVHKTFTDSHSNSGIQINITGSASSSVNTDSSGNATFVPGNGTYTAHATEPTGYYESGNTCLNVTVSSGVTTNCTITDSPSSGTLRINKTTVGGNGTFEFAISGPTSSNTNVTTVSGAGTSGSLTVSSGTYTVTETVPTGWTLTSSDCVGSFSIAPGGTTTCTFVNTKQPKLTVVKTVLNGSTGATTLASAFQMKVDNVNVIQGATNIQTVGTHTITETGPAGYIASYSSECPNGVATLANGDDKTCTVTNTAIAPTLTINKTVSNTHGGNKEAVDFQGKIDSNNIAWATPLITTVGSHTASEVTLTGYSPSVWGRDCSTDGSITLALGENKVCTITNADIQPKLVVYKHVINDNGGSLEAGNVTLNASGTNISVTSFSGSEGGTEIFLDAGTYSIDETGVDGYTKSLSVDCSGTIKVGETKYCTVTNDDQQSYVVVNKTVVNDNGGELNPNDFNLTVDGQAVLDEVAYPVNPGTHNVGETNPFGYTAGAWGGDCNARGSVTVGLGETKTCTITNDDIAPTLTFTKVVTNRYGGTLGAIDFPLFINGNQVTSGTPNTLMANRVYTLTESQQTGYSGGYFTGDCNAAGSISLSVGDNKTCYISNTDVQPKLTVTKIVTNDNGGTKVVTDFPLFVGSTSVKSGAQNGFNAGIYTVSETGVTGYTSTISGDCATNGSITLNAGDIKSCTITNDDIAPILTVTKVVENRGGSDNSVSEFPLSVDSVTVVSGVQNTFSAGSHTVSEVSKDGFTAVISGDCSTNGSITLNPGDIKACTITNTRDVGSITVIKDATPNSAQNFRFTGSLGSFDLDDDSDETLSNTKVFSTLSTGTYTVTEPSVSGWELDSVTCVGGADTDTHERNAVVKLGKNENVTCTFYNSKLNNITAHKYEDLNLNGTQGENEPNLSGWNMALYSGLSCAGESLSSGTTDSSGNVTFSDLRAGNYSVRETLKDDWKNTTPICQNITLTRNGGEQVSFGNYEYATLTVYKFQDDNQNGRRDVNEDETSEVTLPGWEINLSEDDSEDKTTKTTGTDGSVIFDTITPGSFDLSENQQDGWNLSEIYCPSLESSTSQNSLSLTLRSGQDVTCYIGNYTDPKISISKTNFAEGDKTPGSSVTYRIFLRVTGSKVNNLTVRDLLPKGFVYRPGSYQVKINGLLVTIDEPIYHSPGTWKIGNVNKDDEIELLYMADISSDQQPGNYFDVAQAQGTSLANETIYASALDGYVDKTFAGTNVNVVKDQTRSDDYNVEKFVQGQVLGASTDLPATGANELWLLGALLSLYFGYKLVKSTK